MEHFFIIVVRTAPGPQRLQTGCVFRRVLRGKFLVECFFKLFLVSERTENTEDFLICFGFFLHGDEPVDTEYCCYNQQNR